MKRIIISVIAAMCLFFVGCSDEEIIEIGEEDKQVINDEVNASGDENDSRLVVVYICGEVNKPGVYELDENCRVIDAVSAAGGYTEKACDTYLNLAGVVSDEQKIYVPSLDEIEDEASLASLSDGDSTNNTAGAQAVNINKATKEELMSLPGIGESKAEKIIAYREENGAFSSPEGIMQISGIKDGLYNKIKDRICAK